MLIVTAGLVWLTWVGILGVATGVGLLLTRRWGDLGPGRLREGLWLGLAASTAVIVIGNLVLPASGWSAGAVGLLLVVTGACGWVLWCRSGARLTAPRGPGLALTLVLLVASGALAFLALGQPLNYDAGLYHLGAIAYAHDYGTVPGLANLHDRFGFNSSMYPVGALLSNGPWLGEGFRLVNGLILLAMGADLALRASQFARGRERTPGTYVMLGGTVIVWAFVLQVSQDRLVSPTPDTLSMALVVVSGAALADACARRPPLASPAAVALATAAMAGAARPLNWVFWLLTVVVVVATFRRRLLSRPIVVGVAVSIVLGAAMAVRDVILSGWLLYPLSALPMPVPWRAADPEATAEAIASWARYRFWDASGAESGPWLLTWLSHALVDWAVVLMIVMVMLWLVLVLVRRNASCAPAYVAMVPAAGSLVLWFANAPDPRFAWGLLLLVGLIPLAAVVSARPGLQTLSVYGATAVLAVALLGPIVRGGYATVSSTVESSPVRLGPVLLDRRLAPLPDVAVVGRTLSDGTAIVSPAEADQCWGTFPLCTPSYAGDGIRSRGPSVRDGFLPTAPGQGEP